MYEKHFGLKFRPFGSKAEGSRVFVGPQQAKNIASLQKGLGAPDAVVTVTGPVGVGKTTIVNRALETLHTGRTAAHIGRMSMSPQEVVELLMAGFGIKQSQQGSIRRYAAFRRLLQQQSASNIPVAIVIEDAQRLGTDALAEVEALTAADTGDAASANIVLMGQPGLHDLLSAPELARLAQRVRLRQKVQSLSRAEVQGYLKHSIREAGGDYDAIFANGIVDIVYGCSEGVPRMINTLCETALTTALEEQSAQVTVALMRQVAADVFAYEGEVVEASDTPAMDTPAEIEPVVEISPKVDASANADDEIDWESPPKVETHAEITNNFDPDIDRGMVVESGCYPEIAETEAADATLQATSGDDEALIDDTNMQAIPELINDTQPNLRELQASADDELAGIPVLNPIVNEIGESSESAADDEADIESTQTVAHLGAPAADEAVHKAPDAESAESGETSDAEASEDDFDLDAALSPEADSTNVMPGITLNFDAVAGESRAAETDSPATEADPTPEPAREAIEKAPPDGDDLPTLSDDMRVDTNAPVPRAEKPAPAAAASEPDATPVSDEITSAPAMREPSGLAIDAAGTPEIDALEAALAAAKNGTLATQDASPDKPGANGARTPERAEDAPVAVPEITLDEAVRDEQIQNARLDKFREEIGNASSLEDISDMMAETLFGCEEFDQIAAAVVANPPEGLQSGASKFAPSPVKLTDDEMPNAANDGADLRLEETLSEAIPVAKPVAKPVTKPVAEPVAKPVAKPFVKRTMDPDIPLNESVALRIEMLNAMKSKATTKAEHIELGKEDPAVAKGTQPEPIELQIDTSITQTLKALNVSKVTESVEDEKPEKKAGGLFSRFKKSS